MTGGAKASPGFRRIRRWRGKALHSTDATLDRLLFLHLEKSGGMSLRLALAGIFPPGVVSPHCDADSFAATAARHPFVVGHVDLETARAAMPGLGWFTVLRRPDQRILSLMNFWKQQIDEDTPYWTGGSEIERAAYARAAKADPARFLETDNPKIVKQTHNLACHRITGAPQGDRTPDDYAEEAFRRLRDEALFFGLHEHHDLSLLQLPMILAVEPHALDLSATRVNRTRSRRLSGVHPELLEHPAIAADTILYRRARRLFEERLPHLTAHAFQAVAAMR